MTGQTPAAQHVRLPSASTRNSAAAHTRILNRRISYHEGVNQNTILNTTRNILADHSIR